MPSDIKAGIVLVNAFTTGGADSYNAYIDYIDRNEATRNAHYNEFVIKDLKKMGRTLIMQMKTLLIISVIWITRKKQAAFSLQVKTL